MPPRHRRRILHVLLFAIAPLFFTPSARAEPKPLRVYILAGQSNMVGNGSVQTFGYLGDDPETAPMLGRMLDDDGDPYVCERVWISSLNGRMNQYGGEGFGRLTAGYGARMDTPSEPRGYIGPEYLFGITMERAYDGPILIIKTAWGGQNLSVDFRPPGAGPYRFNDWQIEDYTRRGVLDRVRAQKEEATGRNYRYMIEHIRHVLSDIQRVCPAYDESAGYELAGFVWFQGWNDFSDAHTYRVQEGEDQYRPYSDLLSQLIRDVRSDLDAPRLPVVIGVMGTYGSYTPGTFNARNQSEARMRRFREAMAAPASEEEFADTVVAVQTAAFWDERLGAIDLKQQQLRQMRSHLEKQTAGHPNEDGSMTREQQRAYLAAYRAELITPEEEALLDRAASIGGFIHYFGSAKAYAQIGHAFAQALLAMESEDE